MAKKDTKDIRALLQQRARPKMSVKICLRGDLNAEIYRLDDQLVQIRKKDVDLRLTGNPEAKAIAERIQVLQEEAEGSTIEVVLEALERKQWRDLVAKHPAKDKGQDFDPSIFNDAVPACIVEPEMDEETRDKLLEGLTQGQWEELAGAVHALNIGDGSVPFSRLASRALQGSGETSKQPGPGE